MKSKMKRIQVIGFALALSLLAGCSQLLFYPERTIQVTPAAAGLTYRDIELVTRDGVKLHAWWLPAKDAVPIKGTILHLHGNGGNLGTHLGGSFWLPEQGYQVLMLDYRGYGRSGGVAKLPDVYLDLEAAFDWLNRSPETQGKPLVVLGQSIGGALAVHYLASHPEQAAALQALVLDGVPADYRQVARHVLGGSWLTWAFQIPLSWLIPSEGSAIHAMPELTMPKLLFHSIDDDIVPYDNAIDLYQSAQLPRALQLTRGPHVYTFSENVWREVMLHYLTHPQRFSGVRRLEELPFIETSQP